MYACPVASVSHPTPLTAAWGSQGSSGGSAAPSSGSPVPSIRDKGDKADNSRRWDRLHRPVVLPPELLSRLSETAPARPQLQQGPSSQSGTDHAASNKAQVISGKPCQRGGRPWAAWLPF